MVRPCEATVLSHRRPSWKTLRTRRRPDSSQQRRPDLNTQVPRCHLQSYLARCCIAIWQHFCNALWHRITITYSMISTETIMATRRSGTDGLTEHQRGAVLDRFPIRHSHPGGRHLGLHRSRTPLGVHTLSDFEPSTAAGSAHDALPQVLQEDGQMENVLDSPAVHRRAHNAEPVPRDTCSGRGKVQNLGDRHCMRGAAQGQIAMQ